MSAVADVTCLHPVTLLLSKLKFEIRLHQKRTFPNLSPFSIGLDNAARQLLDILKFDNV